MIGRLVPWTSWEEWSEVSSWLYSEDPLLRRKGVERVAVWQLRGRVPVSVEITASFVEALLGESSQSVQMLRMQLALCVIRLVNGIVDPNQQKKRVASSVAILANNVGIPPILVDIRHQATHNELPTLPQLKLASAQALHWLHESYWAPQQGFVVVDRGRIEDLLVCLLEHSVERSQHIIAMSKRPLEQGSSEEEGASEQPVRSNKKTEHSKRWATMMGKLREMVHPAATALLAQVVLDSEALAPPTRPEPTAEELAGITRRRDANLEAWEDVVKALAREWPALPTQILSYALDRLLRSLASPPSPPTAESAVDTTVGSVQERSRVLLHYIERALVEREGALQVAVSDLLTMQAEAARQTLAALRAAPENPAAASGGVLAAAATAVCTALRSLRSVTSAAVKSDRSAVRGEKEKVSAARVLTDQALQLASRLIKAWEGKGRGPIGDKDPEEEKEVQEGDEPPAKRQRTGEGEGPEDLLAAALAMKERMESGAAAGSTEDSPSEDAEGTGAATSFFWDLCDSWNPCPLGKLPWDLDPIQGRLPELTVHTGGSVGGMPSSLAPFVPPQASRRAPQPAAFATYMGLGGYEEDGVEGGDAEEEDYLGAAYAAAAAAREAPAVVEEEPAAPAPEDPARNAALSWILDAAKGEATGGLQLFGV